MFLKCVALLVILSKDILAQNCPLNATHMDKRWIYAVRPTASTWDALHTDYLQDQQKLYLICNANVPTIELLCNHGTLQPLPPNANCARRIRATYTGMGSDNACRSKGGEMYEIRYTLPDGANIPLYRVCYNRAKEEAIYARHLVYSSELPASTYQRPQFTLSGVVSRQRADSFEARNVYDTFVRLLGPGQTYAKSNKDLVLERGHLANSQDFVSYDQMDETFKYVNVMPQFRGVNRSNWKRLENWLNNLPSGTSYAEIITGAYGILELEHSETSVPVPMYLMEGNKNPLPMWLYKVVKYNGSCFAFVTYNNKSNAATGSSNSLCRSIVCPADLKLSSEPGSGDTYCCNYNQFIRKIGRHVALC